MPIALALVVVVVVEIVGTVRWRRMLRRHEAILARHERNLEQARTQ